MKLLIYSQTSKVQQVSEWISNFILHCTLCCTCDYLSCYKVNPCFCPIQISTRWFSWEVLDISFFNQKRPEKNSDISTSPINLANMHFNKSRNTGIIRFYKGYKLWVFYFNRVIDIFGGDIYQLCSIKWLVSTTFVTSCLSMNPFKIYIFSLILSWQFNY